MPRKYTPREWVAAFWARVNRDDGPIMPGMDTPCWEWTAGQNAAGYGRVRQNGRMESTHRVALAGALGRGLQPGEWALHRCDNPPCCRPDHLFLGDRAANIRDRDSKGRGADTRGVRNARAKLTEDDVRAIRSAQLTASPRAKKPGKVTISSLAAHYGVSRPIISGIRAGRGWGHLCG